MSCIGRIPVEILPGVEVDVNGQDISVRSPKGTLSLAITTPTTVKAEGNEVVVTHANDERESRSLHGSTRTLVANMAEGVTKGYAKVLEIQGASYRVTQKGVALEFALGSLYPANVGPPEGIVFKVGGNRVTVESISKKQTGEVAANIRKVRPPGPYKGKGVRYLGKNVRRKVGKTGK